MNAKRSNIIGLFFLIWAVILVIGQLAICTIKSDEYSRLAVSQRTDNIPVKNRRGKLLDRNMIPLVENTPDDTRNFNGLYYKQGTPPLRTARYPEDGTACHLIGYVNSEGKGVCGLEKTFESILNAEVYDSINVVKDAHGRVIEDVGMRYIAAKGEGDSVALTLDAHIQKICHNALTSRKITGAVVVMDVDSFDVLSMASSPVYNQRDITGYLLGEEGEFINRCVSPYNAGSIFKIVTLAEALENSGGNKVYWCSGQFKTDEHIFACHKYDGHGLQSMTDALKNSCNCAFYHMGAELGAEKIINMAAKFGLGERLVYCTDFEENPGNLPENEIFTENDSINYSIGQGEILITPLQAANMTAVIAAGGVKKKVNIADRFMDSGGNIKRVLREIGEERVTSAYTADFIKNAMRLAVTEGTAKSLCNNPARIAGKTGTAETGWKKNGDNMVHGWFCGYFPYDNPKYAMAVIVENGGSGAQSAVPVFGEIAEEIIKIYPIG